MDPRIREDDRSISVMSNKSLRHRVLEIVSQIPRGKTMTYKEVAIAAGNGNAARAVGAIMKTNFDPAIPCHRVIRSDGKAGGYNRGADLKILRLREEGASD
jgi:O-6-methylguanine DNA methyltransferase